MNTTAPVQMAKGPEQKQNFMERLGGLKTAAMIALLSVFGIQEANVDDFTQKVKSNTQQGLQTTVNYSLQALNAIMDATATDAHAGLANIQAAEWEKATKLQVEATTAAQEKAAAEAKLAAAKQSAAVTAQEKTVTAQEKTVTAQEKELAIKRAEIAKNELAEVQKGLAIAQQKLKSLDAKDKSLDAKNNILNNINTIVVKLSGLEKTDPKVVDLLKQLNECKLWLQNICNQWVLVCDITDTEIFNSIDRIRDMYMKNIASIN